MDEEGNCARFSMHRKVQRKLDTRVIGDYPFGTVKIKVLAKYPSILTEIIFIPRNEQLNTLLHTKLRCIASIGSQV